MRGEKELQICQYQIIDHLLSLTELFCRLSMPQCDHTHQTNSSKVFRTALSCWVLINQLLWKKLYFGDPIGSTSFGDPQLHLSQSLLTRINFVRPTLLAPLHLTHFSYLNFTQRADAFFSVSSWLNTYTIRLLCVNHIKTVWCLFLSLMGCSLKQSGLEFSY